MATLALVAAGVTAGAAGLALLYGGWYNIGATAQHFPFVPCCRISMEVLGKLSGNEGVIQ